MTILQNAADVLRLFGAGCTELTVSEVTTRLDMPKANASRLMKAMREAGILETIGDTRRHRPGRLMLDLSAAFRRSSGVIGKASEVVAGVTQRFGHTGYVTLREGLEVTAVADFPGTNALRVVSNIGRRLPAAKSATGRSLLARLPEAEVRALYAGQADLDVLLVNLAAVRRQGYAYSSQEATPGVDSIAIAVADPATDEAVSLCIVYPHAVVDKAGHAEMLDALASGAARIAEELGDTAFVTPKT
ncbi:MAG: transcriptional regulator [Rhodobacterales bacterium 32-67-9]|nr:MAG: transcriptional regulator [Rhodobacterales bacterium 32-67-9]